MKSRAPGVLFALLAAAAITASCASTRLEDPGGEGAGPGLLGGAGEGGVAGSVGGGDAATDCVLGEERCDCRADGSCDPGLSCLSNLCVDAGPLCPFAGDGYCDEPELCPVGSDPDCCATPHDGVCEESSGGGSCAEGSDSFDCGYCPSVWIEDGFCDEPSYCPPGTDEVDCCAQPYDEVCDEASGGGECPDGTDSFDCGYCPDEWLGDGLC